jgi:hypothetical protein
MKISSKFILLALGFGATSNLFAQTTINTCPTGYTPAVVNIQASVSTATNCPLLEDPELRKFIERYASGTTFAYPNPDPMVSGTCMSGEIVTGTITLPNQTPIAVRGRTESAQRFFPEAAALGNPLLMNGVTFVSGAAYTVVSLTGASSKFKLNLAFSDRFTVNYGVFPFRDTEDMLVVGSSGNFSVTGRLTGTAEIFTPPGMPIVNAPFTVAGSLCVK